MGDGLDEERERRALQERAYGRGPTPLSPAEADRLRDLQRRRVVPAGPEVSAVVDTAAPGEGPAPGPEAWFASAVAEDAATTGPPHVLAVPKEPGSDPVTVAADPGSSSIGPPHVLGETAPPSRWRALLADRTIAGRWRRPRVLVTAAAALVAAGLAIGWSVPRAPDVALPMTAAHEERREAVLEALNGLDDIDGGSLVLLSESNPFDDDVPPENEALLWYVTRKGGEWVCAVLDVWGETPGATCLPRVAVVKDGLSVSGEVQRARSDGGSAGGDSLTTSFHGTVRLTPRGVPVATLTAQTYPSPGSRPWYREREAAAERIREALEITYPPTLLGHLDDAPVWLANTQDGTLCLVLEEGDEPRLGCEAIVVRGRDGESAGIGPVLLLRMSVPATPTREAALLEVLNDPMSGAVLTITRQADPSTAWGPRL
ncbi:hypothetical protein G3H63_09105 [Microbacterium resistens]|uniref:hypothetical protein n=1 Tax=Microbacterium resistens TaxID=156977 RepID=UPI001C58EAC2|nr:hypothetical protein [Microbacterium resistens]MBW1639229.1 hypothetical protein [Microbacterium resistens]